MVVTKTRSKRRASPSEQAAFVAGTPSLRRERHLPTSSPLLPAGELQAEGFEGDGGYYEWSLDANRWLFYAESDGEPISDSTWQFDWIQTLHNGCSEKYADDPNVFVAGDMLWYPVQGRPKIRIGPDVMIAFGRPKGNRGSYVQWHEGNIAPQVVFEVLSKGNIKKEMIDKRAFYEQYGVLEYYVYHPMKNTLEGWIRENALLLFAPILPIQDWTSPRLDVRFDLLAEPGTLTIYNSDGSRFRTYLEAAKSEKMLRQERDTVVQERDIIVQERDVAAQERDVAAQERDAARRRAEKLVEKLRALGIEPNDLNEDGEE